MSAFDLVDRLCLANLNLNANLAFAQPLHSNVVLTLYYNENTDGGDTIRLYI